MLVFLERKHASPVSDRQFSFSFCFRFEKLVIFAVYLTLHYGGFPYFFLYYYYLIPQCLLNILLCISRYNTACDVSYAMPRLIRFCRVFPALKFFLAAARTNFCPAKAVFDRFMGFMRDVNDCCACDSTHVNWGRESREPFPAHSLWACLHLQFSLVGQLSDREKTNPPNSKRFQTTYVWDAFQTKLDTCKCICFLKPHTGASQ